MNVSRKGPCVMDGCERPIRARGMCNAHYQSARKAGDFQPHVPPPCSVDGCTRKHLSNGLCAMHHGRWFKKGDPGSVESSRPCLPRIDANGYVKVRSQSEHRMIMEEILGRPLRPGETVHHKNGIRHDNDPRNLELWAGAQPAGQRVTDLLEHAIHVLRTYGAELSSDNFALAC